MKTINKGILTGFQDRQDFFSFPFSLFLSPILLIIQYHKIIS